MTESKPQNRPLGYARVGTYGQTLDAQLAQLRKAGCAKIFREKVTGARADRRELLKLLKAVAPGDVVTVTRIDRLAPLDLRPVRHRQADRGRQGTVSVTGGAVGRYCHQHRAADDCRAWGLADVERDLICTRTAEGRSRAKARGQHMSTRRVYKWVTGTVENL
jgi:DNA invertase Pin-like site-specific DNA recombinase